MKQNVSHRLVRTLLLAVPLLAATACTVRVVMPEVPATHPAHPDAASAPLPEPSPLLDSYRPVAPPPEMEPMDHESMDHGSMDHEAMDHEAMGHGVVDPAEEEAEIDHEAMGHGAAATEEEAAEEPEEDPHAEHRAEPPPPAGRRGAEAR